MAKMRQPLIIVGQPRSGTSLLVRILNESSDYLVFDDLYILQFIDSHDLWNSKDSASLRKIADFLLSKYRQKALGVPEGRLSIFPLSASDLQSLQQLVEKLDYKAYEWPGVIETLSSEAARLGGKPGWGYKTPQDYLHFEKLRKVFPDAVFVFVLRDPRSVLASYKNQPKVAAARFNPLRYNPLIQGAAWKLAATSYFTNKERLGDRVIIIQYERIVKETNKVLAELAELTGTPFKAVDIAQLGSNTSFKGHQVKKVTPTELWLADLQIREVRKKLGYDYEDPEVQLADLPELAAILGRSGMFYVRECVSSADRRKRVLRVLQSYVGGQRRGLA